MVRQGSAKPSSTSSNLVVTSKRFPEASASGIFCFALSPASLLALSDATRQTPPFVTCGDIFPRSGESLSSKGESLAKPVTLQLSRKVCRSNSAPERIFQSHRISPLHLGCPAGSLPAPAAYLCFEDTTSATFCQDLLLKYNKSSPLRRLRASSPKGGNNDDRRQRRKQGGAVGAAASKTQAERSGCWEPQPGCEAPLACRATLR